MNKIIKKDEFTGFKDYSGLNKKNEYNKEQAELLAEALTERNQLAKRVAFLEELANENEELKPFLWTTLDGITKPLHKLDDDHLVNIMNHILERGGIIKAEIRNEAKARGIVVPKDPNERWSDRLLALEGADDDYLDEIDF